MANIYTTIQRKVNEGKFDVPPYALRRMAQRKFSVSDIKNVIFRPFNSYPLTDDASHDRYVFEGYLKDGRMLTVIVIVRGDVVVKTLF